MNNEEENALPTLFDFVDAVNFNKVDLVNSEETEKLFRDNKFMVCRALAMNKETVLIAGRANELTDKVDSYMLWQYLRNIIPKKKRFTKWVKQMAVSDDVKFLSDYYQVNIKVATLYRKLMTDEEIEILRGRTFEGGADKAEKLPSKGRRK